MIAYGQDGKHLTAMTAAMMQDTGWYLVDYDFVFAYDYPNKNLGCSFLRDHKNCDPKAFPTYFCNPPQYSNYNFGPCEPDGYCVSICNKLHTTFAPNCGILDAGNCSNN